MPESTGMSQFALSLTQAIDFPRKSKAFPKTFVALSAMASIVPSFCHLTRVSANDDIFLPYQIQGAALSDHAVVHYADYFGK